MIQFLGSKPRDCYAETKEELDYWMLTFGRALDLKKGIMPE